VNLVLWIENLLPSGPWAISGWVIFLVAVGWAVLGLLFIAACVHSSRLSQKLRVTNHIVGDWRRWYQDELDRQDRQANSPGPEVTKKTLIEDHHTNKDKETTE